MEKTEELFKRQLQVCEALLTKEPQNELVSKACTSAKSAVSALSSLNGEAGVEKSDSEGFKTALKHYTQSVLDSTYFTECQFVEEGFTRDQAKENIFQIVSSLSLPVTLCGDSPEQVASLFDVQQLECLHWRVGALLYMYCHTLMGSEERKKEIDVEEFREYCCVGVCHLKLMLATRTPLSPDEEYTALDPSVPQLLQRGIFSDVHMISLMYVGELCYWCWERMKNSCSDTQSAVKTAESAASTGEEVRKEEKDVPKETLSVQNERIEQKESMADELDIQRLKLNADIDKDKLSSDVKPKTEGTFDSATALATVSSEEEKQLDRGDTSQVKRCESKLYSLLLKTKGVEFIETWTLNFDPLKEGIETLAKYVEIARGPLKDHGWSYDRAVRLLVELKRASVKK